MNSQLANIGHSRFRFFCSAAFLFLVLTATNLFAAISVSVNIVDPGNQYSAFHNVLLVNTVAAGEQWGSRLQGNSSIEVDILFNDSIARATGRSAVSSFVTQRNGLIIAEQGMAAEVRTGIDPNGSAADVEFVFNSDYLQNELWFDPAPNSANPVIPANRTDAYSVLLHEFGHALTFNGWQNSFDGSYQDQFRSTYDELKVFDGDNFFFIGENAMSLYGGPVPVTYGNSTHLGNQAPRPGADLVPDDLMNGELFRRGFRYGISELNWAIVADTGLTVSAVPEPTFPFVAAVAAGLVIIRPRRKRASAGSAVEKEFWNGRSI